MQMNIVSSFSWLLFDIFLTKNFPNKKDITVLVSLLVCSVFFYSIFSYLAYYLLLFHGEITYVISDRMLKFKRNT